MVGVYGLILAGGKGKRMGWRDKGELRLGGQYMVRRVVERLKPQVTEAVIICNDVSPIYAASRLQLIADEVRDAGPLAGISAGMNYLRKRKPDCRWVVVVTVDSPFLPVDLATRLVRKMETSGAEIVSAESQGRRHPLFSLWPLWMAGELEAAVKSGEARKVSHWVDGYKSASLEWPATPIDPFFNINRPEDLDAAE